jgi:hypothetical protein
LALAGLLAHASDMHAATILYRGQTRGVYVRTAVEGTGGELDDRDTGEGAPDFGPFETTLEVNASAPGAQAHSDGWHSSELLEFLIRGSGSANVNASDSGMGSKAEGQVILDVPGVWFEVDEATQFWLSADMSIDVTACAESAQMAFIRLSGPAGLILESSISGNESVSILETGTLEPGKMYRLEAHMNLLTQTTADALTESLVAGGSCNFQLVVPEPTTLAAFVLGSFAMMRRRR